ncbi:DUF2490 domain-containing protein [Flavobacterium sp. AS60]|uniref:DUF2490 domain-containing protein n=1 Tax=Flavobacterium anseongense TaxID=2910677 RepID=UPI001F1CA5E4|nr:DUF2490 domain-containing protein [Flavobacterium sp. AS60]MCF6128303.1 DUF2490 domain-containing protein [Flavobacterium sp. AS60]
MKKIGIVLLLLIYSNCFSQKTIEDQRVWFAYTGQYKVSEKWGYHIEAQFRLDNQLEQNLQNLFRVGGIYYLSKSKNISGGYALVNTYSASLNEFFRENRFWEQYQHNTKWNENANTIIHRFRLEQRWVEQLAIEGNTTNYQNRFRYLNRNLFHITNLKSGNEEIYAVVQDEIFLNLGDNKINSKVIDQNRFLIGLGLNYNNNIRLELGYMNQFVTSNSGNNAMNHVVSVSLLQNLDLEKH